MVSTGHSPFKLVWLSLPPDLWETDWIHELIPKATVPYDEIGYDSQTTPPQLFENACIVFNHASDYEAYFQQYEHARIPFGAIHLSDETLGDSCDYLSLEMCRFAFRNYFHPEFSCHPKVVTFGLGYKKGFTNTATQAPSSVFPWYHWCFAGVVHHKRRLEALVSFERFIPHLVVGSQQLHTGVPIHQYRAILEHSKFAVCPIGQCNLDTFRFYEALESGTVPVVIGNTPEQRLDEMGKSSYWHAMFPGESDAFPWVQGDTWDECADIVKNVLNDPQRFLEMRKRCRNFWNRWKKKWSRQMCQSFLSLSGV